MAKNRPVRIVTRSREILALAGRSPELAGALQLAAGALCRAASLAFDEGDVAAPLDVFVDAGLELYRAMGGEEGGR